ncbi:MAG: hypothetical protein IKG82_16855, partial [Oscillospiraceae bacterium]|nr:hypothetical protein [Oscillospiraceae bacterium]
MNGTSLNGDIQVCATSDILQQVGCRDLPMMYTKLHMADALRDKSESNPHYHGLTAEQMKQLPEQITAPAMIFDSISRRVNGNSSIIVILGSTDNDSAPLLMSIKPNGRGKLNADTVDANFITSIYGKEHDFSDYIERIVASDSVLYCDQAKMQSLFAQIGQPVPQSLAAIADKTVLHQSRNIANGFGQTFTVQDDINGQQPISSELRAQIMQEFQAKHGLKGDVFVRKDSQYDDGNKGRAYDLLIKNGKRLSFRQQVFTLTFGEFFSEQKLRDGLAAMEQNPDFQKYLEQQAHAQRVQDGTVRVGDKFRLAMQEVEITSLDGGLYPDDVVVKSVSQTSNGGMYTVTRNISMSDLLQGEYLGNTAKDQPELTNEELLAQEMLEDEKAMQDICLYLASDEMTDYSEALFDAAISERYSAMDHPPVSAAILAMSEQFRSGKLDPADLAKALYESGGISVHRDNDLVMFERLREEDGTRFSCRNVSKLVSWEEIGRFQMQAFYNWYADMLTEAAREYPEVAQQNAQRIAAATELMQSYGLISANTEAAAPVEEVAASSNFETEEPAIVLFEVLSDGTIIARDPEDTEPDTNEMAAFAVIHENGTVVFVSPFYSDEQEAAINDRALVQKAAFTEAWNALPEDEQYKRICLTANEAQYKQIFSEDMLIADKIAKYAPSIIFGEAEFPISPDSIAAAWGNMDRVYFDGNQSFTWCFYSQDTQNFVINSFGLDVLKEAMRYDAPTEIIQERGSQQQVSINDAAFVDTVKSYLDQREDFAIPSRSHGSLREIADYLNGYYQRTISQIDIPEYG